MPPAQDLLGVTLIGGFLGAGKTTLLSRLVQAPDAGRLGVVVNDFGDLAVDAALITELRGDVMRLGNGCICCSLQGDLMRALLAFKDGGEVDHVLVETSGVSDTQVLATELLELERSGVLRVDAVVVVVDADGFPRLLTEHPELGRAQVRAADLVVLNKVDLVDEAQLAAVEARIRALAPRARIARAVEADVPLALISGHGLEARALPTRADHSGHAHAHPVFSAFTFRESQTLTWMKLGPLLATLPPGVFRAKGTVAICERPGARVLVQVVGSRVHVRTLETGEAAGTELVFIGTGAVQHADALIAALRDCVA